MKKVGQVKQWAVLACMMAIICLGFPLEGKAAGMMEEAKKVGDQWMTVIDAGKYKESWDQAASIFQNKVSQEEWESTARSTLEPLGPVVSRELRVIVYTPHGVPNNPPGEYMVIRFNTTFKNKTDTAVETLTLVKEPKAGWRTAGYFVQTEDVGKRRPHP